MDNVNIKTVFLTRQKNNYLKGPLGNMVLICIRSVQKLLGSPHPQLLHASEGKAKYFASLLTPLPGHLITEKAQVEVPLGASN